MHTVTAMAVEITLGARFAIWQQMELRVEGTVTVTVNIQIEHSKVITAKCPQFKYHIDSALLL